MTGAQIHPTAIVDPEASLDDGVSVGPYCVVGPRVRLGRGTTLASHVVVDGNTTLGTGNRVFSFASIGAEPQDKKFHGERNELVIGNDNVIREFATLQPGTEGGGGVTRVGVVLEQADAQAMNGLPQQLEHACEHSAVAIGETRHECVEGVRICSHRVGSRIPS